MGAKVVVFTQEGISTGYFLDPKVEMMPPHHYKLTGVFYDHDGNLPHRIEFNPEVLPYIADIEGFTKCEHNKLASVYVKRSRQPVEMIGICQCSEAIANF